MNTEILKTFCANDDIRCNDPFSDENYTYATDCHIAIKVDRIGEFNKEITIEAIKTVAFAPIHDGEWEKLPDYTLPKKEKCSRCGGTRFSSQCKECEGEGDVEWHSGYHTYYAECKSCNGECYEAGGLEKCRMCSGTGKGSFGWDKHVDIFGERISPNLLEKLEALESVEVFIPANKNMVSFRFDGGVGIMMTMGKG